VGKSVARRRAAATDNKRRTFVQQGEFEAPEPGLSALMKLRNTLAEFPLIRFASSARDVAASGACQGPPEGAGRELGARRQAEASGKFRSAATASPFPFWSLTATAKRCLVTTAVLSCSMANPAALRATADLLETSVVRNIKGAAS
jgi:hypothetical protein